MKESLFAILVVVFIEQKAQSLDWDQRVSHAACCHPDPPCLSHHFYEPLKNLPPQPLKNQPSQPASFYYPVEETKISQETAPKTILAGISQGNLKIYFFLQKKFLRNFARNKLPQIPASGFLKHTVNTGQIKAEVFTRSLSLYLPR